MESLDHLINPTFRLPKSRPEVRLLSGHTSGSLGSPVDPLNHTAAPEAQSVTYSIVTSNVVKLLKCRHSDVDLN
jgi:hypothetical protein